MSYYVDFYQHIPIGIDVVNECDNDAIPIGIDVTEECDNDNIPVSIDVTEECDNDNIGIGIDIDSYSTQFFLRCPIGIDVTNPGYLPSMAGVEIIDRVPVVSLLEPSYEEHVVKIYTKVFITTLTNTYNIPNEDLLGVKVSWKKNSPITFSIKLKNFDRKYTKTTGDFSDLITKGEYSSIRGTLKYVNIHMTSIFYKGGTEYRETQTFPQLVILGVSGDLILEVQGIDRICYILYKKRSWDTFCFRDACVETDLRYATITNTLHATSSSGENPFSDNSTGYLFSIDRTKATSYATMPSTEGVIIRYKLSGDTWINRAEFYMGGFIPQAATLYPDGTYLYLFANGKPTKKFIAATLHYEGNSDTYTESGEELIHSGKYIAPNLQGSSFDPFKGFCLYINGSPAKIPADYSIIDEAFQLTSKYIKQPEGQTQGSSSYTPIASIVAVSPISSYEFLDHPEKGIFVKARLETYSFLETDFPFKVSLNHNDFWIKNNINADSVTTIDIVEEILQAVVGNWIIMPQGNELCFHTYNAVLADEYPSTVSFVIPEKLTRSFSISDNASNVINTINVIRPSIIDKKYVEILPTNLQGSEEGDQ